MTGYRAPIALFVYNRPGHTRATLEALARNDGAKQSTLLVFADGPGENTSEQNLKRIDDVRQIVLGTKWCGSVELIPSPTNKGLASSIRDGINSVLAAHDRLIVLEDDLQTSRGFLRYMNDALACYACENRVFQVSGFMVKTPIWAPRSGFLRVSTSWGWATWRRAWSCYRNDAENLLEEVSRKGRAEFDLDGCSFHFDELRRNVEGELNTWAVRWYASIFLNDGLCLYPGRSLVRNIGFDGSGSHCLQDTNNVQRNLSLANRVAVKRRPVVEDPALLGAMQKYYRQLLKTWTATRLRDRVRKKLVKTYSRLVS